MSEDVQLASAAPGAGDATGSIRNVVKNAHRWGGDGQKPIFRKIRAVLVAKHPEVIAKAFGGDPDRAAGWIKSRWYMLRGRPVPGHSGKAVHASGGAPVVIRLSLPKPVVVRIRPGAK